MNKINQLQKEYDEYFKIIKKYQLEDLIAYSKTVRVLLVSDDDIKHFNDICGIFKIFFHDIDFARSAQEGIEKFHQKKYDLIITKLEMKKMHGIDLIQEIRSISRHIAILVLSSSSDHYIELIRLGIDGYILQPIEVDQFTTIIKKVIENLQNKQGVYEYRLHLEDLVQQKTLQLQELNQTLEKKVEEEVKKNLENEKHISSQARLASMGEMLGNIAHQWRQPLSIISTSASGIQIKHETGILTDESLHKHLENILDHTQHLSDTIDVFRDFLKENKEFNEAILQDRIEKAIYIVKSSLDNFFIKLQNNIPAHPPVKINLIKGELVQVLVNIINNAKDVLIERKVCNPTITLDLQCIDDRVLLYIEDIAGGIPDDIINKVFDPYFTTKHQSHGTGLGLYMSHKIIHESLHGSLSVRNTINGARFCIELPTSN